MNSLLMLLLLFHERVHYFYRISKAVSLKGGLKMLFVIRVVDF